MDVNIKNRTEVSENQHVKGCECVSGNGKPTLHNDKK